MNVWKSLTSKSQNLSLKRISSFTNTDEEIATLESFYATTQGKLPAITFDDKRQILDLLDVRGKLAVENGEKVVYVKCLIAQQRLLVVAT